jgi:hypothetical protein
MEQLKRLTPEGEYRVKKHLESGKDVSELPDDIIEENVVEIPNLEADLDGLEADLEAAIAEGDTVSGRSRGTTIDAHAAPQIHQRINIDRRDAAIDGLWHWLCVFRFPDFVYNRWDRDGDIVEKFLAGGTNIYSNAIHRLWWGAELTHDGDDYSRTQTLFSQGELANDVLDRRFARYEHAAHVVTDELDDEPSSRISKTTTNLRNELSIYTLELMSESGITRLVNEVEEG